MKRFFIELRTAFLALCVLTLICCGAYPVAVWALAQVLFPYQANGSLIVAEDGTIRGSELLAQSFSGQQYFHPRPSHAGHGYDGAGSGASNLGPTSRRLQELIQERLQAYRQENGLGEGEVVPADAVTASASGLDPHISLANAERQVPRVALARKLTEREVRLCLERSIDFAGWRSLGEPVVNVMKVNLALDLR